MTVVTGQVQDIGMAPLSGALIATAVEFRTSGDFVVAPESRSWPIVNGDVSVDLLPGPTRITIQVGSHARDSFDVIVPDEPVTLAQLVEDAFPWTPSVVSAVAEHRAAAEQARDEAVAAANEFDLTATATTGAAGSNAAVTVTGDGPAYGLSFTVPRGDKGDQGDKGDTGTTEWSGINGKPATFPPTIGTTASTAKAGNYVPAWPEVTGKPTTFTPATHSHPVTDLTMTGTASSTTFARGDGTWATPANTTYSVPSQAEAEAGAATTGRAFSAQRVRQAIDARAVTRQGAATGLWIGTEATLPPTGTTGVLYVTY